MTLKQTTGLFNEGHLMDTGKERFEKRKVGKEKGC